MRVQCVAAVALFLAALVGVLKAQQITSLPGLSFPISFQQYAGYVDVNTTYGRNLFYWFVEAQTNASSSPLIMWFSGGPGCSSLLALTSENGPFYVNQDGATLSPNPNSWNRVANILYVESPAGVGFSYGTDPKGLSTDDTQTCDDAFNFLTGWIALYPQYKGRTLYLSGESYAGHYVPQLAAKMLASPNPSLNLKGFIIGNPATDAVADSAYVADFVYSHALISEETYAFVQHECYNASRSLSSSVDRTYRDFAPVAEGISFGSRKCNAAQMSMYKEMTMNIDGNDIYAACPMGPNMGCENFTAMTSYLNLPAVQAALHVSPQFAGPWEGCSFTLNYTQSVASVLPLYPSLLRTLRVAIYSGDVTYNIPFLGTVSWTARVGGAAVRPWRHWMQSKTWLGGYSVKYTNNLTFVTVRGAGHMVPLYQPAAAFSVFANFIANTL